MVRSGETYDEGLKTTISGEGRGSAGTQPTSAPVTKAWGAGPETGPPLVIERPDMLLQMLKNPRSLSHEIFYRDHAPVSPVGALFRIRRRPPLAGPSGRQEKKVTRYKISLVTGKETRYSVPAMSKTIMTAREVNGILEILDEVRTASLKFETIRMGLRNSGEAAFVVMLDQATDRLVKAWQIAAGILKRGGWQLCEGSETGVPVAMPLEGTFPALDFDGAVGEGALPDETPQSKDLPGQTAKQKPVTGKKKPVTGGGKGRK